MNFTNAKPFRDQLVILLYDVPVMSYFSNLYNLHVYIKTWNVSYRSILNLYTTLHRNKRVSMHV